MVKRVVKNRSFWLVLLAAAVCLAAAVRLSPLVAQAAPAAGVTYTCAPDLVVSANVRVVAHCAVGYVVTGGSPIIFWFAYPTSDSGNASRMLSLFETAKATGSTVTFYFDTADTSGTSYGCLASNCRAIWAATTP